MSNEVAEKGVNAGPDDFKRAFYNFQRFNSKTPQHDTNNLLHIEQATADLGFPMTIKDASACSLLDTTAKKPVTS